MQIKAKILVTHNNNYLILRRKEIPLAQNVTKAHRVRKPKMCFKDVGKTEWNHNVERIF